MDVRNIGVSLNVAGTVSPDGRFINLDIAPAHVRQIGDVGAVNVAGGTVSTREFKADALQPVFYSMRTITNITLRTGRHMLFAVHQSPQPGVIEVFIVHAEVLGSWQSGESHE
jgi:hypothetical protein